MKRFSTIFLFVLCTVVCVTDFKAGFADESQSLSDIHVRTESGLPIKLIVVKKDTVYRPKLEENVEKPIDPLNISWLLTPANGKDGFYRFGNTEGEEIGWIKKEFVQQWKTAFTLSPSKGTNFSVYDKDNPTKEILNLREDVEDIAEFAKHNVFILDSADGTPFKPEESKDVIVAVPLEKHKDGITETELKKDISLETMFVIDTTGSMMPCIEVVQEVIRKTAEELNRMAGLQNRVRFGLVEYRDQEDMPNACRTVCKLTDFTTFQNALNNLKVDGGGDIPEEVYCGLREAIKDAGWDNISSKHIFLVGDAPAKGKGEKWAGVSGLSRKDIIALAHSADKFQNSVAGINIHCIVAGAGSIDSDAKEQFEELSQNGKSGDYKVCFIELDTTDEASKKAAIDKLNKFGSGFKGVTNIAEEGTSALDSINPSESVFTSAFYKILVEIKDPVLEGIANDRNSEGELIAGKRVFLIESVTNNLASNLKTLHNTLKNLDMKKRQNTETIINLIKNSLITGTTAGTEVKDDTKLEDILAKDFPIKLEILEITPKAIARMGQDKYDEFCKDLLNVQKRLNAISDKKWNPLKVPKDFKKDVEDYQEEGYQFVPTSTF
jgi:hypothetical protein